MGEEKHGVSTLSAGSRDPKGAATLGISAARRMAALANCHQLPIDYLSLVLRMQAIIKLGQRNAAEVAAKAVAS
eukprot:2331361-Amphidinium_carterae.1